MPRKANLSKAKIKHIADKAAGGNTEPGKRPLEYSRKQLTPSVVGYADPWISKIEAASQLPTTNKARLLISDRTRCEFPAFAVPEEAAKLSRRIGWEQNMFETLTAATGGSKTADTPAFCNHEESLIKRKSLLTCFK